MQENKLSFREALSKPDIFSVTWELIPGRGALEETQDHILEMAELAAKDKRINGITLTDNPGGRPAILTHPLAIEIKKMGIEPIIHFTCKDKNRNSIQSDLYAMERFGLHNLLVMTGDYPTEGYTGRPKPVFDIDPVHALRLIESMNKGESVPAPKGSVTLKPTNFFAGAVVSPFKKIEAEQVPQYYKLHKKINSGAKFIITQLGYDPRKFDELRRYMEINNLNVPLIGNIFVLSATAAKVMNENRVPGCVVTDEMLKVLQEEKQKYGNAKERQLLWSAKLYAILKGLKYKGVNISGHGLKYPDVVYIIEKGEELSHNWQEFAREFQSLHSNVFYYFKKDGSAMLNTNEPVDREDTGPKKFHPGYNIFYGLHHLAFDKKGPLFPAMKALCKAIDKSWFEGAFTRFEHRVKFRTNGCRFCGDCAMVERAYICPMAHCPKQQRNGPCGGSFEGWCEVYPNKQKCIYVRVYERFKTKGLETVTRDDYIPPCNWDLYDTSSWLNYFNSRDFAKIDDIEKK